MSATREAPDHWQAALLEATCQSLKSKGKHLQAPRENNVKVGVWGVGLQGNYFILDQFLNLSVVYLSTKLGS